MVPTSPLAIHVLVERWPSDSPTRHVLARVRIDHWSGGWASAGRGADYQIAIDAPETIEAGAEIDDPDALFATELATLQTLVATNEPLPGFSADEWAAFQHRADSVSLAAESALSGLGTAERLMAARLLRSVARLSKERIGALIAIEREGSLANLVETGIQIDAELNALQSSIRQAQQISAWQTAALVPGTVVLGPNSRVVMEFNDDLLQAFYVLDILNTARTPIDIGGPLTIDLPSGAGGATVLEGSSPAAKGSA